MRLNVATLCDFAQVRDNLLTIASGGVTRVWREKLPSNLGVYFACQVEIEPDEQPFPHELKVLVTGPSGTRIAEANAAFQIARQPGGPAHEPDEVALFPFAVPFFLPQVVEYGWVTFALTLDGTDAGALRLKIEQRPRVTEAPMATPGGFTRPN